MFLAIVEETDLTCHCCIAFPWTPLARGLSPGLQPRDITPWSSQPHAGHRAKNGLCSTSARQYRMRCKGTKKGKWASDTGNPWNTRPPKVWYGWYRTGRGTGPPVHAEDAEEEGPGLVQGQHPQGKGPGSIFSSLSTSPPHSSQINHNGGCQLERYFSHPLCPSLALLLPHPSGQCCWLTSHCCHNYLIIVKDSEPVYSELSILRDWWGFPLREHCGTAQRGGQAETPGPPLLLCSCTERVCVLGPPGTHRPGSKTVSTQGGGPQRKRTRYDFLNIRENIFNLNHFVIYAWP